MFTINIIKRGGDKSYFGSQEFEYQYQSPVIPQKGEFVQNGLDKDGTVVNIRHVVENGVLKRVDVYLNPFGPH